MSGPADPIPLPSRDARFAVAALVCVALLGRAVYLALPVNSDTAMFVYAGKLVAAGGRPGVDLLDNKLPTVGLLMSVPWRWLGAFWPGYAAIGLILSAIGLWMLSRAARCCWGSHAACVVAVGGAVWLNFTPAVYGGLQLETIGSFFAAIAAATTLRLLRTADWRDAILIGLCAGTAAWAKPTGVAIGVAAALAVLIAGDGGVRERLRTVAWIGLGLGGPLVLAAWTIVVTDMADALPETVRQLRDYASQSTLDAVDLAKPVVVLALLGMPVFVLGVIHRRQRRPSMAGRADVLFVLLWLAAETAGVVSQRRMYAYHFLPLAGPTALAGGLLARRATPKTLTMAFGPFAAASAIWAVTAFAARPADSRDDRVIAYFRTHTRDGELIWTDDYPRLLVETGRTAGSRVPLIFLMANGNDSPDFFGQTLLDDFAERRPSLIALADPMRVAQLYRNHMADVASSTGRADAIERQMRAVQAYLDAHYRVEKDIENVRIWRRKAEPSGAFVADDAAGGR